MVWQRIRNHPGLAALLVLLLVLPAPLVWLGSSTDLLDPVLYSAVIEADVEFDAECNMVSRQITSESGPQDHVAKLEAWSSETLLDDLSQHRAMWTHLTDKGWTPKEIEAFARDFGTHSCIEHAGEFSTRSRLWRNWLGLMTSFSIDVRDMHYEYEQVQGRIREWS